MEAKRLKGTGVMPLSVRIHSPWSGQGSPSHVATANEGTDLDDLSDSEMVVLHLGDSGNERMESSKLTDIPVGYSGYQDKRSSSPVVSP